MTTPVNMAVLDHADMMVNVGVTAAIITLLTSYFYVFPVADAVVGT